MSKKYSATIKGQVMFKDESKKGNKYIGIYNPISKEIERVFIDDETFSLIHDGEEISLECILHCKTSPYIIGSIA